MSNLISIHLQSYKAQIEEIVKDLHDLTIKISHEELAKTVSELRNRIHEPFMFVIVGEVKSGKSSFVNALLNTGKEITKVAPQPMTDTIQQILFGEEEEVVTINPFLKKILIPEETLKEIAIVDTPGTNTIIDHHQEITESFIPASDLIVFVFEAKNPYRQSAWEFFDYIHSDWRKKIIFVLQQKDLLPAEDLSVNIEGVRDFAIKKGISEPQVFAVSAKEELEGAKEGSGFGAVRDFIRQHITGGKAPVLKLQNNIQLSQTLNERIASGLEDRKEQWQADVAFRKDIKDTLEHQEVKSYKQVELLSENLIAGYDRITLKKEKELKHGLSFFTLLRKSIRSIFNKKQSPKDWLESLAQELEDQLNTELKTKLNDGVVDLADSVQQMAQVIDLKIRTSTTILKNDHDVFSDIAEKRNKILDELQSAFRTFVNTSENFTDEELFPDKSTLSPNLATGSGIAVIGIILATVTNGVVFDITGGILTAIGLLFAGFATRGKRKKIIEGYQEEIQKGRIQLEQEVDSQLKTYINNLKNKIDHNFDNFDLMLENEEKQIQQLTAMYEDIHQRLLAMDNEIQETLK